MGWFKHEDWDDVKNLVVLDAKNGSHDLNVASLVAVRVRIAQRVGKVALELFHECLRPHVRKGMEQNNPFQGILKSHLYDRLISRSWCVYFLQETVLKSHSNFGDEVATSLEIYNRTTLVIYVGFMKDYDICRANYLTSIVAHFGIRYCFLCFWSLLYVVFQSKHKAIQIFFYVSCLTDRSPIP